MNRRSKGVGRTGGGLATGVCAALASIILSLTLVEFGLRAVGIDHLPTLWANELGTGYAVSGNGIYRFDPSLNMVRMRPHYARKMFFNGYHWHHETDWMGFRNPLDRDRVDVALVGDSMIYGHGLEEPQTVRSHLERLLNRPVANLGIQSAAMDYEYEIIKHDAVRLNPRYLFVFFLNNDITDVEGRLSNSEMRRFLELPEDDHTTRYFDLKPDRRHEDGDFSICDFYVVRTGLLFKHLLTRWIFDYQAPRLHQGRPTGAASALKPAQRPALPVAMPRTPSVPDRLAWMTQPPFEGDPRMQLAMQFHLYAILKARNFAERQGMRMIYVFISVPLPYDSLYERSIADYCRTNGIEFFSLRPALDEAQRAGKQVYLPRDGHFSDEGTAVAAQAIADRFHLREPAAWPSAGPVGLPALYSKDRR